jgi:uncharacterized protein YjbI with pentapeptide repeats
VRFVDCRLSGVDWTRAAWQGTRLGEPLAFSGCTLNHSTFIGLLLPGIEFLACRVLNVDFREADLSGANFAGSDLAESLFSGTDLRGANFVGARQYTIAPHENRLAGARFAMPEAMALLYAMDIILEEAR